MEKIAQEGHTGLSETTKIVSYNMQVDILSKILKKTINVVVWDTQGMGDPFSDDEATAKEIAEKCKETDLLVYCLDVQGRFANDDATGIKLLTVLTFANTVGAPHGRDAATLLQEKISSWTHIIKRLMKEKLKFPHDIADNISSWVSLLSAPGIDDWFSSFWAESFTKTKPSAQPALLGINTSRLSSEEYISITKSGGSI